MSGEGSIGRRLLGGWTAIAARFGFVQTLVILALVYAVVIGPVALVIGVTRRDLLGKRGLHAPESAWAQSESAEPDLERAKLLS